MASALLAFENEAPASLKDKQTAPNEVDEEDMFADSSDEQESPMKTPTLLEVAKREGVSATPSLMEVARSLEVEEQNDRPKPSLATLAAEMNQEEHERETTKAQADKVQRALDAASSEVRAERIAQHNEQVVTGLKAAVAEQQQQYEDEEFEDDAAS
ncbi:hypothetical protein GQ600_168 [Phytophthora cactorum]|nr:hypothetical protein GQ600_168 [Phytophthora cactorum]